MNVIDHFKIVPFVWADHKYNVQVWTSVDGGHGFYYCGNGRFCKNLTEVFEYIRAWKSPWFEVVDYRNRRWPNAEIVTKMPAGGDWHKDLTTFDRPLNGVWIENYKTGERAILYTGDAEAIR